MGIDKEVIDQLIFIMFPGEQLIKNEDGSIVYLKREEIQVDTSRENVEVRLEQTSSKEKVILLASNAALDITGFLSFLVWLGNHGYEYSYCSPTMLCFST